MAESHCIHKSLPLGTDHDKETKMTESYAVEEIYFIAFMCCLFLTAAVFLLPAVDDVLHLSYETDAWFICFAVVKMGCFVFEAFLTFMLVVYFFERLLHMNTIWNHESHCKECWEEFYQEHEVVRFMMLVALAMALFMMYQVFDAGTDIQHSNHTVSAFAIVYAVSKVLCFICWALVTVAHGVKFLNHSKTRNEVENLNEVENASA